MLMTIEYYRAKGNFLVGLLRSGCDELAEVISTINDRIPIGKHITFVSVCTKSKFKAVTLENSCILETNTKVLPGHTVLCDEIKTEGDTLVGVAPELAAERIAKACSLRSGDEFLLEVYDTRRLF